MLKIYEAFKFADKHHKGQVRKASGIPYITHPLAVSYLLVQYKISKNLAELIMAALLHDALEDTSATFEQIAKKFSPLVASLCLELKNDPALIAKLGKLEYHKRKLVGMSSWGLVLKLVDRLHNILDHPTKKMVTETLALMSHLRKNRKLSKTQARIAADIEAACNERAAQAAAAAA